MLGLAILLILNIFLIIYIVVPVFSGQVASTSGLVNVLNTMYVSESGAVGIGTGGRAAAATLEARLIFFFVACV